MSEEYTISGLLDPAISEQEVYDTLSSVMMDRGYTLSTGSWDDRNPVNDTREAREAMLSGSYLWMECDREDLYFDIGTSGVKEMRTEDYWMLVLIVSDVIKHQDSIDYMDEVEGFTCELCDQLPVRLLYASLDTSKVGPNPKFIESSVEEISSLCYFADDVLGDSLREQILDAPVYSITELDDGLCIRVSSTFGSSHSKIEEITDVVDLG